MHALRVFSLGLVLAAALAPSIASAAATPCPRPSPLPNPHSVANRNPGGDLASMLRLYTVANPCNERADRIAYFEDAGKLFDADGKRIDPAQHYVESFKGRAISCEPNPFSRDGYVAMIRSYETLAMRKAHENQAIPPLVLWIHGGLVPGFEALGSAAKRMCQMYPNDTCQPTHDTPGVLNGFPIFVVWHTGLAEGLLASAFSSRARETSAHGIVNRVLTRPTREQEFFDFCVTHDDQKSDFNLNHIEVLFRTYDYLSAPNVWRFYQNEISDTFMLPGDTDLSPTAIDASDRVGLWLVRDIARLHEEFGDKFRVVIVGHSMGAEWGSWLVETYDRYAGPVPLRDDGMRFELALLAPAVPFSTFNRALRTGRIGRFRMFTMTDANEREDHLTEFGAISSKTKGIYPLSLLYFISGVLNPYPDYPLLGMQRYARDHRYTDDPQMKSPLIVDVLARLRDMSPDYVVPSPTEGTPAPGLQSCSVHHGDFDGDPETTQSIKWLVNAGWGLSASTGDAMPIPPLKPCPSLTPKPAG